MSLDDVIFQRLSTYPPLTSLLATWNAEPAIFAHESPDDTDTGWTASTPSVSGDVQYPRIVFELQRMTSQSDVLQGTLHLTVWVRDGQNGPLEQIVIQLRNRMDDAALYDPIEGMAVLGSLPQELKLPRNTEGTRVFGTDVVYRVQVLPPNSTYEPDPVATMNRWTEDWMDPHIHVAPSDWSPNDNNPALYWRVDSRRSRPIDYEWWGYWVDVEIVGHVLCPSSYARGAWMRLLADTLKLPSMRRIRMGDGGPLFVGGITESLGNNPQTQGQIHLSARYGMRTTSVPGGFDRPPIPPDIEPWPPPPLVPTPPPVTPVWSPSVQYVSDVDTGQQLDEADVEFVPDVDTLPQPPPQALSTGGASDAEPEQ